MNPAFLNKGETHHRASSTLKYLSTLTRQLSIRPPTVLTLAGLLLTGPVFGNPTPFSRIFVFGDSLSDTGNFCHLTGQPQWPYAEGRFSNGPLWVEYLTEALALKLLPGDNYSVAGATTGHENYLAPGLPGLQDEIAAFLATTVPGGADPDALYIVWAGANDFLVTLERAGDPLELISEGVANTANAIQLLRHAGARHILVANVPDLGLTPYALRLGSATSAQITQLSAAYNLALEATLRMLEDAGIPTIHVGAFGTLQDMVNFPARFGFNNVTEPYLVVYAANPGDGDPTRFLFWDDIHPTTSAHEVFGEKALNSILVHFSRRRADDAPGAWANSLKGLVEAATEND